MNLSCVVLYCWINGNKGKCSTCIANKISFKDMGKKKLLFKSSKKSPQNIYRILWLSWQIHVVWKTFRFWDPLKSPNGPSRLFPYNVPYSLYLYWSLIYLGWCPYGLQDHMDIIVHEAGLANPMAIQVLFFKIVLN